jgi:hypothetical protein
MFVQEGGSSSEFYLSAWPTKGEAHVARVSCTKAGYRTSPVLVVPYSLTKHPDFHEAVEQILKATTNFGYAQ